MDPELRRHVVRKTSRRVVFVRPHRTVRTPADTIRVWTQRRRSFSITAGMWLVLAIVGMPTHLGVAFTVLAFAAALLSAAVVVKANVLLRRAQLELGQP